MTKRKSIHFVVITPERQVLDETTDALVVIPAHDGELGILQDRAPILCELGVGQLRYQKQGKEHRVFIDGGFAQVLDNDVTVLTDNALPEDDVTPEVVAAAQQAAEKAERDHEPPAVRQRARRRASVLRSLRRPR